MTLCQKATADATHHSLPLLPLCRPTRLGASKRFLASKLKMGSKQYYIASMKFLHNTFLICIYHSFIQWWVFCCRYQILYLSIKKFKLSKKTLPTCCHCVSSLKSLALKTIKTNLRHPLNWSWIIQLLL